MKTSNKFVSVILKAAFVLSFSALCQSAFSQNVSSAEAQTESPTTIVLGQSSEAQPIYIIDKQAKTLEELRSMSPEDISSVYVLKGAEAMEFGRVGKNGIVTIVPKVVKIDSTNPKSFDIPGTYIRVTKKPAVYVNDVKGKYSKVKNILKSASDYFYMKPEIATQYFGKDGKNGVLVVKTKTK